MGTAKDSPSPWHRDQYGKIVDSKGETVYFRRTASLLSGERDEIDCAEANTDLATIAPELLATAQLLLSELESHIRSEYEGTGMFAGMMADLEPHRLVIAKATGEAS